MDQNNTLQMLHSLRDSRVFTPEQKAKIETTWANMTEVQLAELQNILSQENAVHQKHEAEINRIKMLANQKKLKTIYAFAENQSKVKEEKELLELDHQLATL